MRDSNNFNNNYLILFVHEVETIEMFKWREQMQYETLYN